MNKKSPNPSRRDVLQVGGALAAETMLGRLPLSKASDLVWDNLTDDDVRKAIERAIAFIKQQQQHDGEWPNRPNYSDGLTPLCLLALSHAGCTSADDAIQKAMPRLRAYRSNSTYTTSLQTQVFCRVEPDRNLVLILRNTKWLESRQVPTGPREGMWAQPAPGSTDHIDNSMTHFAILALYEALCKGVPVNGKTLRLAHDYWLRSQNKDGSWGWGPGDEGTGSMTCAGIASLIITTKLLDPADARVENEHIRCCCDQNTSSYLDRAFEWLEKHFSVHQNPNFDFWYSYYMYSLERVGRLSARRFIGKHDWYREGVAALLESQMLNGAWPSDVQFDRSEDPIVSTCFSLMFLAKGRRPILLAHLKHKPFDDWNRHRNALFNLMTHAEKTWQKEMTYQVVDIAHATVEDLLESPVLFLSGQNAPELGEEEIKKLRMYIDRGGFLFAQPSCGNGEFNQGFREIIRKMYPESDATLHLLPPQHTVWYADAPVNPKYLHELWGIDVGCRTGVIYCPNDLACIWELASDGRIDAYPQPVKNQIQAALGIGLNVLAYATQREVKYKTPTMPTPETAASKGFDRGKLYVANLRNSSGCSAAPAAVNNLMRLFSQHYKNAAGYECRDVAPTAPELFEYHLVFFHGRTAFEFTPAERQQLRTYLERGGMMFADAICSSQEFGRSFRREIQTIFPNQPLERIPPDHLLFQKNYGGTDITSVSRRQFSKTKRGEPTEMVVPHGKPHLEGLLLEDRYAVIFSPYDISCALESHATPDCEGYSHEDAVKIAINVLLYSFAQ